MKRLKFTKDIKASAEKIYRAMLGLDSLNTYKEWTAAFNPTSTIEGSWEKGSKMYFIGTDETGKKGGMVSEIAENKPAQFVSIRHYGIFDDGKEITSGPEVEKWANSFENYTFEEKQGYTTVIVDIDVVEEYLDYFQTTYPDALEKLKSIVEKS
ncbi:MAG: SRPBCC domain-containing protein [Cytophagaceae bacterium]